MRRGGGSKPVRADPARGDLVLSASNSMKAILAPDAAEETGWTSILYFYNHRNMEQTPAPIPHVTRAATAFAALGLRGTPVDPAPPGARGIDWGCRSACLGDDVGVTGSVLTHHVKHLVSAGLVEQRRDGRRILCSVVITEVEALSGFLISECCADQGAVPHPRDTTDG
jgi:ArsR family transcriptional regulator